jgi:NAD dependent epimerase/dehydratase family enzyme
MAGALLLASQRVIPERLLAARYAFRLPDFESALRAILSRKS